MISLRAMALAFIGLAALTLLAACSEEPEQEPATTGQAAEAPAAAPETEPEPDLAPGPDDGHLPQQYDNIPIRLGDLDEMEEHRAIRVLTVYSIGHYYLEDATIKGLVRETTQRFEDFINKRFKRGTLRVNVVVIPVARNQLIPALLEGRGDLIVASLSITPEREALVDFSVPVNKPFDEILVTGPAAPELTSIDDLAGQTIHVRHSSSYRESIEQLNTSFASRGLDPVVVEDVSEVLEDDDLAEMVNAGVIPWLVVDDYKMQWWHNTFTDLQAREDIVLHEDVKLAWAFRKDSPLLKEAVNEFLKKNREGTLVGNVLHNRYIRDFDWGEHALGKEDYLRFAKLKPLFQKYGEMYGIEYLMLGAQGYQESRLDQDARNPSGAVGVMQIKPSTARDKHVGIDDVYNVENNIHAGTKYLDFLRSRYFSDPGVEEVDQILLAFAAYNVGPTRMINLRNAARKLGYDPDKWFGNVELVAARKVGREPVQYVANIYRYYLAYRMSELQLTERQLARERAGMH